MLQHVTLEVRPELVRECVAFWALLGFEEMVAPPTLRDRFTWVEREGTQIHLNPLEDPTAAREGHVAVVAPDYEDVLRALAERGFALREGSNAWNAPRTFVRDPAGHLIEVMSAPPHPPWPGEAG
jgi:catechol 2,3-dioxygenase-like lactoylglutathione lyase family enzyme